MKKQLALSVLLGGAVGAMAGEKPLVPALPRVYEIRLVSSSIPEIPVQMTGKPGFYSKHIVAFNSPHSVHAFVRLAGSDKDLGDVEEFKNRVFAPPRMAHPDPTAHGDYGTQPRAMNRFGQVVGDLNVSDGCLDSQGAFFYDGKMHDLQALVPKESGWVLYSAKSINDRGEISGAGNKGVYLLVPRPAVKDKK